MSLENDSNAKIRAKEFVKKVLKNESASLILNIEEAQEIIWWWVYTEEFEDEETEIENLYVEFVYETEKDKNERFIKQRIFDKQNTEEVKEDMWLPISLEEFLKNIKQKGI